MDVHVRASDAADDVVDDDADTDDHQTMWREKRTIARKKVVEL